MTDFRTGAVFLVNFDPSVGHEYKKIRPAVIIQSDKTINQTALITVMPITSQLNNGQKDDIPVKSKPDNGLFTDSLIKVGCIHSFDRKRFLKKIGTVSEDVLEKISVYLKKHFEICLEANNNKQHYTKVESPEHLRELLD